jgi:dCMP deaminase
MRPSWDDYFLTLAVDVSKRSTCQRRNIGALLVRDRRILTTGYNGPPPGMDHCEEMGGCLRQQLNVPSGERLDVCRAIHAEANAILQAAIHGVVILGSVLYCTNTPCSGCAKLLIGAGVARMIVIDGYPDELSAKLLEEAGVIVERRPRNEELQGTLREAMPPV